jgi:hypothetical protein
MANATTFLLALASLAVLIVALTHLSVWIGDRETKDEEDLDRIRNEEKHSRDSGFHQAPRHALVARLEAISDELYAQTKQLRHHERKRSILEITAVTAAIAAAIFAFWSAWVFAGQLSEMQTERRPWIQLSKFTPLGIDVMEGGVDIRVLPYARNIGHSPAEGVFTVDKLYPGLSITDERSAAEAACKDAADRTYRSIQTIIFPDEEQPLDDWVFVISTSDIKKHRRDEAALQYAGRLVMLGKERADEMMQEDLARPLFSTFTVAGCVTYFYRDGRASGQTAFLLDITRRCLESPVGKCAFDVSHVAEFGPETMWITEIRRSVFAR